jgi:cardiolipin synthase
MRRILLGATGLLIALEAITVIILQIVSAQRKHHRQEGSFPHPNQGEVPLGENNLQLYDYGRDLYDAMLAAIDAAQESIYLESYIWYAVLGERVLSPLRILM